MTLIYLDTNVYARPFDDQRKATIRAEANAFLNIMDAVKQQRLIILSSDILIFEVENILNEEKQMKVKEYLALCTHHISYSEHVIQLGKQIEQMCYTRSRYLFFSDEPDTFRGTVGTR